MVAEDITIAPLQTAGQYQTCERLQQIIWRSDPVEVVPTHLLITAQRHGGLVLGGFDATGEMIGCLFGSTGRLEPDDPATAGSTAPTLWASCRNGRAVAWATG